MAVLRLSLLISLVAGCAEWVPVEVGVDASTRGSADAQVRHRDGGVRPRVDAALPPPDLAWPDDAPRFVSVTMGARHTCALTDEATVWCWGSDSHGQLGQGLVHRHDCENAPCRPWAEPIASLEGVVQVAAHGPATCALLEDGTVRCYGDEHTRTTWPPLVRIALTRGVPYGIDAHGNLLRARHQDTAEVLHEGVVDFASGSEHSCMLTQTGEVWCWGSNESSQLGVPMSGPGSCLGRCENPMRVETLARVMQIAAAGDTTCARLVDRTVRCWGHVGARTVPYPSTIPELAGVRSISVTSGAACGIDEEGSIVCHGTSILGDDEGALAGTTALSLGPDHACVVRDDGAVLCAGANQSGELGRAPSADRQHVALPIAVTRPDGGEPPPPPFRGDLDWDRLWTIPRSCEIERARVPSALLSVSSEPCVDGPASCRVIRTTPGLTATLTNRSYHDGTRGYAVFTGWFEERHFTAIVATDGEVLALWQDATAEPGCRIADIALGDGHAAVWLEVDPYADRVLHATIGEIGALRAPTWIASATRPEMQVSRSAVLVRDSPFLVGDLGTSRLSGGSGLVGTLAGTSTVLAISSTRSEIRIGDLENPLERWLLADDVDVFNIATDGRDVVWVQASPPGRIADYTTWELWTAPYVAPPERPTARRVAAEPRTSYEYDIVVANGWAGWVSYAGYDIVLVRLSDGARRRIVPPPSSRIVSLGYITEEEVAYSVRSTGDQAGLYVLDPRDLPIE